MSPYDDYDAPYGGGYPAAGAPPGAAPGAGYNGAPAGYNCDGWRWDANARRYVAAKVSCN